MQLRLTLAALALLAGVAVLAFGLWRITAHEYRVVHVYAIAEPENGGSNAQIEALQAYLEGISATIQSEVHSATPADIGRSTQQLLDQLAASSNLPAEGPALQQD